MKELKNLILSGKDLVQSKFLDFMASGSDGVDGSTKGVHLRWSLQRNLGENHLPKGKLANVGADYEAPVGVGFNKNDDFVELYKVEYTEKFPLKVDLLNDDILSINKNTWVFEKEIKTIDHTSIKRKLEVVFDSLKYAMHSSGKNVNVASDREAFLKAYDGVVEFNAGDNLSFKGSVTLKHEGVAGDAAIRVEAISIQENSIEGKDEPFLSVRKSFTLSNGATPPSDIPVVDENVILQPNGIGRYEMINENITSIRFDYTKSFPIELTFETYDDYLMGVSANQVWKGIGEEDGFSLAYNAADDSTVFNRLERGGVNGSWPRFRESTHPASGGATSYKVVTNNYKTKWINSMKNGVKNYLTESKKAENLKAVIKKAENDPKGLDMHVLDGLTIASLDYHVAKMLGLGYADDAGFANADSGKKYIYLIKYTTTTKLEDGLDADLVHYSMSIPLGSDDNFLPSAPVLNDFTFGYPIRKDQKIIQKPLTDTNGYTKVGRAHIINLNVDQDYSALGLDSFFKQSTDYYYTASSFPTFFGIENKGQELGVWEDHYRDPKILSTPAFKDAKNNPEPEGILNQLDKSIYRHEQTESGQHEYAVYGINAFSRISPLSNAKTVDTVFPRPNRLLPPANVKAQMVQAEVPGMMTTKIEQHLRTQIGGADKTLVRLLFDVNHIQTGNYIYGNKVQWFFNEQQPKTIEGKVKTINTKLANSAEFEITTEAFDYDSQTPKVTITPTVTAEDISSNRYKGAYLTTPQGRFEILDFQKDGDDLAVIKMKKEIKEDVTFDELNKEFGISQSPIVPLVGEQFLVIEKSHVPSYWDAQLTKEINTPNLSQFEVTASGTTANNITGKILSIQPTTGNATEVFVDQNLTTASKAGQLEYTTILGVKDVVSTSDLILKGDREEMLTGVTHLHIQNSKDSDGKYIVSDSDYDPEKNETIITILKTTPGALSLTDNQFAITFAQKADILSIDGGDNSFTVKGELTNEMLFTYVEPSYNVEGNVSLTPRGGMASYASILPVLDELEEVEDEHNSNGTPNEVYHKHFGRYIIEFNDASLSEHPDVDVEWYKGVIRIPNIDNTEMVELNVLSIVREPSTTTTLGAIKTPLSLIVEDFSYDDDAQTSPLGLVVADVNDANNKRNNVLVNFHPGYRSYFYADAGKMDASKLLPAGKTLEKVSYVGGRTLDTYSSTPLSSDVSLPSPLRVINVRPPVDPGRPAGPIFATRPDTYVKSTYTFDVEFDEDPYGTIFFRSNSKAILGKLYKPETLETVYNDIVKFRNEDIANNTSYFTELMWTISRLNLETSGTNTFKNYAPAGFVGYRFPNPDNNKTFIPSADPTADLWYPFPADGTNLPANNIHYIFKNKIKEQKFELSKAELLRKVINLAFTPLTENPLRYDHIKLGKETSSIKPVIRDENGKQIKTNDPIYNPHPMAVKLSSSPAKVRFTDYTLDGASNEVFFYFGMGMGNMGDTGKGGDISGPVQLTNAAPAPQPIVQKVRSVIEDSNKGIKPAIDFSVNRYGAQHRIKSVKLYRTNDPKRALSVRNMDMIKNIPVDETTVTIDFKDEFENDKTPLFGDLLFYRTVAVKEIINEVGEKEDIPSEPSDIAMTNLVDVVNPKAPKIRTSSGASSSTQLFDVKLSWKKTVHNGTYRIYKMNDSGNWVKVEEITKNNNDVVEYKLLDPINLYDEDGNKIYHRFKIDVENSSGLLNIEELPITIVTGANDLLQQLTDTVQVQDSTNTFNPLTDVNVPATTEFPGSLKVKDVIGLMPAGHTFSKMEVTVTDSDGGTKMKPITTVGGEVEFVQADGIKLDNTKLNISYTVKVKLFTDIAPNGAIFTYKIQYGPQNAFIDLKDIVSFTDSNNGVINPAKTTSVDKGVAYPGSITIKDILTVPSGQVFTKTEVTLSDDEGNSHNKEITSAGGEVTFNHEDGGLKLDNSSLNKTYTVTAKVITDKNPNGHLYTYYIGYTYDPKNALLDLKNVVGFEDNDTNKSQPLKNSSFSTSTDPNGSITITDKLDTPLPVGHTFTKIDIELSDGTNKVTLPINSLGGNVVFNSTTAAAIKFDNTVPNQTFTITATLFTDKVTGGVPFVYSVKYGS